MSRWEQVVNKFTEIYIYIKYYSILPYIASNVYFDGFYVYPPMPGGVGRYTRNLSLALKRLGVRVYIACNERGEGDFRP
jgi:hypothetical protein